MESLLLPLGAAFLISCVILLSVRSERRDIILERFYLRRRRDSTCKTPPRSLSPVKQRSQSLSENDYSTTLPPSRRPWLVGLDLETPSGRPEAVPDLHTPNRMLPIDKSYLEAANDFHTPCGFSIAEIKALGDFPDYAALSGVPLPKPYHDFHIEKALPRPYRPFRWAYHQTMCTYTYSIIVFVANRCRSSDKDGTRLVARTRKHLQRPLGRAKPTTGRARQCGTTSTPRLRSRM